MEREILTEAKASGQLIIRRPAQFNGVDLELYVTEREIVQGHHFCLVVSVHIVSVTFSLDKLGVCLKILVSCSIVIGLLNEYIKR